MLSPTGAAGFPLHFSRPETLRWVACSGWTRHMFCLVFLFFSPLSNPLQTQPAKPFDLRVFSKMSDDYKNLGLRLHWRETINEKTGSILTLMDGCTGWMWRLRLLETSFAWLGCSFALVVIFSCLWSKLGGFSWPFSSFQLSNLLALSASSFLSRTWASNFDGTKDSAKRYRHS